MRRRWAVLMLAVIVICAITVLALENRLRVRERVCATRSVNYPISYCEPKFELAPSRAPM